jgi:RNA polymerase sigma-70 factor (ECF subfamily)
MLTRSPVVVLNRAVALAEVESAEVALTGEFARLADDKRMLSYQPYWAARAALLARAGHAREAADAFTVAIGLTTDGAVRAYLQAQLAHTSSNHE